MSKKVKMGRPPLDGDTTYPRSIRLTKKHIKLAKKLGQDNISKGVRLALDCAEKITEKST